MQEEEILPKRDVREGRTVRLKEKVDAANAEKRKSVNQRNQRKGQGPLPPPPRRVEVNDDEEAEEAVEARTRRRKVS